ncbi:MAG: 50S ribosomal protein L32 [Myxococcota bacterium]|jgi:large subunit ribosomal protein L32|nr:50S ribosomal protein L32 [Myxococcota bacterium]
MAVPKKKKSKMKTRIRRSSHDKLSRPNPGDCPRCAEPKMPHAVCLSCGYYKDQSVIPVVEYGG